MKLSLEFRFVASLVLIGVMALMGVITFVKLEHRQERFIIEQVIQQEYQLSVLPIYLKEYERTKERSLLLKVKQEADHLNYELQLFQQGGILLSGRQKVQIVPFMNEELNTALQRYSTLYGDVYQELSDYWLKESKWSNEEGAIDVSIGKFSDIVDQKISGVLSMNKVLKNRLDQYIDGKAQQYLILNGLMFLLTTFLLFYLYRQLYGQLIEKISELRGGLMAMTHEDGISLEAMDVKENLQQIEEGTLALEGLLSEVDRHIASLGKGEFTLQVSDTLKSHFLGHTLQSVGNALQQLEEHDRHTKWHAEGMAALGEMLNNTEAKSVEEVCLDFVKFMVLQLGCNQGGVYLKDKEQQFFELKGCFAYGKKKYIEKVLEWDEGLLGQAAEEKRLLLFNHVPDGYIEITSGMGEATASCLVICPIMSEGEVLGVIELASFTALESYQTYFLEESSERMGKTLTLLYAHRHTETLLKSSMLVNERLQEHETQLLHNEEELKKTKETLQQQYLQLQEEDVLKKSILEAISQHTACVELDMEGRIIEVNDMYLAMTGYQREELLQQYEKTLVPKEDLEGQYELIWESLKVGQSISGQYRRSHKKGKLLWVEGTYSPIRNSQGETYKVIQFAQFTTEDAERKKLDEEKLKWLREEWPILELNKEGAVQRANAAFVSAFGFSRKDLRQLNFTDLLVEEEAQQNLKLLLEEAFGGEAIEITTFFSTSKEEIKAYQLKLLPVKDLGHQIHMVMALLKDVSITHNKIQSSSVS
ncbi:PAS domain S-box protein [Algivirga pacifica]|uniref:PAS domain-containing protein n=1 Tax=Algivirga pacifica TaxID=1162670 RepID=A0ABP9DKV9_9BACT